MTNGLDTINLLAKVSEVNVIALGGSYHRGFNGFFGLQCEEAISKRRVDVAVMSTTTVHGKSMYTQNERVLRVKRAMMRISRKTVLLVDSSKFQHSALNHIAELTDFDHVIISQETDKEVLSNLRSEGVRFELA